jgi:multidrug efflux pump subunit AcrA (membrane-fusion protein)
MSRVHLGSLSAAGLLVSCLCLQGSAAWKTIDESPSTTATDSAGVRYLELPMLARAAAEAKVPALERGGLRSIDLAPGVQAKTGAQLASLEDREAALMVELAERDLEAARQKYKASKQIEIATAAVEEGRQHLEEATEEAEAAEQQAADETPVQLVRKLEELAADRLEGTIGTKYSGFRVVYAAKRIGSVTDSNDCSGAAAVCRCSACASRTITGRTPACLPAKARTAVAGSAC